MANSNLLKEAIADAKAVRETAIANAKIALEEAFTPRLQSILSQKLQQEIEGEDDEKEEVEEGTYNADGEEEITAEGEDKDEEEVNEEYDKDDAPDGGASDIGDGDNKQPADDANSSSDLAQGNADTDVESSEVGSEDENSEKAAEISEGEDSEEHDDEKKMDEIDSHDDDKKEEGYMEDSHEEEDSVDETDLDLESIIKELEAELSEEEGADHEEELDAEEKEEVEDIADDAVDSHEDEKHDSDMEETYHEEEENSDDMDEEIDLEEILREMGYGSDEVSEIDDKDDKKEEVEENNELEETKAELNEAISTIKTLKKTINEVNLLNAKLLYTNKLFRAYDLNNEQKHKVVETLDRTGNVREVKLVFSTLAESFKFNGTAKKQKASKKINESFASKPVASTAPKKEVIAESTNTMADRFKKLANIR